MSSEDQLLEAVKAGDLERAQHLLVIGINFAECEDENGCSALHLAAHAGNAEMVRLLLRHRAEIDATDGGAREPIHDAAYSGSVETLRALVAAGASLTAVDEDNRSPAHYAANAGSVAMLQELKLQGALMARVAGNQDTPLSVALVEGRDEAARFLLQNGYDADSHLSYLCDLPQDRPAQVRLLLEMGANPEHADESGWRPAFLAARYGHRQMLDLLLDDPRTTQDTLDMTLAIILHAGKRLALGDELLARGADSRIPVVMAGTLKNHKSWLADVDVLRRPLYAELMAGGLAAAMPGGDEGAAAPTASRGMTL